MTSAMRPTNAASKSRAWLAAGAPGWLGVHYLARESRMSRSVRRNDTLAAALFALLVLVAAPLVSSPGSDGKQAAEQPVAAAKGPLRAHPNNPHYFTDGSGKALYLTGSHTWNTLQDWGTNDTIQSLDFKAFVKMLVDH